MTTWLQHVKNYQNEHNCSYKDALKGASLSYTKTGKKAVKVTEETKPKMKRTKKVLVTEENEED